jgi:hypothetical protein
MGGRIRGLGEIDNKAGEKSPQGQATGSRMAGGTDSAKTGGRVATSGIEEGPRWADSKPQRAAGRTTDEESHRRASSSCLKTNEWRQRLWKMLQREMCRQEELGEPRLGDYTNTPDYYTLTRALL